MFIKPPKTNSFYDFGQASLGPDRKHLIIDILDNFSNFDKSDNLFANFDESDICFAHFDKLDNFSRPILTI